MDQNKENINKNKKSYSTGQYPFNFIHRSNFVFKEINRISIRSIKQRSIREFFSKQTGDILSVKNGSWISGDWPGGIIESSYWFDGRILGNTAFNNCTILDPHFQLDAKQIPILIIDSKITANSLTLKKATIKNAKLDNVDLLGIKMLTLENCTISNSYLDAVTTIKCSLKNSTITKSNIIKSVVNGGNADQVHTSNSTWEGAIWRNGSWNCGLWNGGVWKTGKIYIKILGRSTSEMILEIESSHDPARFINFIHDVIRNIFRAETYKLGTSTDGYMSVFLTRKIYHNEARSIIEQLKNMGFPVEAIAIMGMVG